MSNRVVAIKILGIGDYLFPSLPATFTTREHPLYKKTLAGTVTSLTDQLSSEISVFGNLGSDSTMSFSVLSTDVTRGYLLSRNKKEILNISGEPTRIQTYIKPDPGTVSVSTSGPLVVGGFYRIANTAFECVGYTGLYQLNRIWGCAPVPIAISRIGPDDFLGPKVYDVYNGPLGGVEQLPVVIETVDLDSMTPEVIWRGYVSGVTVDTSAHADNQIRVTCSSLMAYVKQAPFVPAWGPVNVTLVRDITGGIFTREDSAQTERAYTITTYENAVYGSIYDPATPVTGATRVNLWQIRDESKGGIAVPDFTANPGSVTINSEYQLTYPTTTTVLDNGYRMFFNEGYYADGNFGPTLDFSPAFVSQRQHGRIVTRWSNRTVAQSPSIRGENCLESSTLAACIADLLLGTYNGDLTFATGARSVNEAAWLPFPSAALDDLIDIPSLYAVCSGYTTPDVPQVNTDLSVAVNGDVSTILPYEADSVETVGDVLEGILKRMGAYMVYDAGKFYFAKWGGVRSTPVIVNDTALAEPSIRLTFDRSLCVMRVNAKYCTDMFQDDVTTIEVPFNNVDLSTIGLGKQVPLGHWQMNPNTPDQPDWGYTQMVANAFSIVMRYSQSAARVDLSLRDAVSDLKVGQEIALTSQYLVNSEGGMGVSGMTGYVLKAARSWQTPTTAYTIILPGYLSPVNKVTVWSASGLVLVTSGTDDIYIDTNWFVAQPGLASDGAPTKDIEAFKYVYDLNGGFYDVQLLDYYGTFKASGTVSAINVGSNLLTVPGLASSAVAGDIIVLAAAPNFVNGSSIYVWDAFLADANAQVAGSSDLANKWVP